MTIHKVPIGANDPKPPMQRDRDPLNARTDLLIQVVF